MTAVMRAALARRMASTMTSSSIRLWFTGGQVGWTMKMSRPADVLVDAHAGFAVGECLDRGIPEGHAHEIGDAPGEVGVGGTAEDF